MIALIAEKDLREFVRDGRLVWAGGLIIVLLTTALCLGWSRQTHIQSERAAGQALDYEAWLAQGDRHPHDAAEQGMHVFKPEPPLAVLDPGIEPFVGSTIWLQAHRQSEIKFRPAQDATGLQRFGDLSVAWVLQTLAPLLIIILGFNAVSGERESGTLRQLMSQGVAAKSFLYGKAIAIVSGIALLVIPAGFAIAVLAFFIAPVDARSDVVWRILFLGVGYSLYLGFWILLVLAVSALVRSSRAALLLLLAVWIFSSLVAPRAVSDLVAAVYPTPSRLQFNEQLESDMDHASTDAWRHDLGLSTKWDPALPLSKWGRALQVDDHAGYGAFDKNFVSLWDTFEHQQNTQQWIGLLIPVVALRSFSMGVAGTDFAQHRDFSMAAEAQRRIIQDIVSDDLVQHADPLGNAHFSYKAGAALWAKVPRFDYRLPSLSFALAHSWPSLLVLGLAFLASAGCATVAFSRLFARSELS